MDDRTNHRPAPAAPDVPPARLPEPGEMPALRTTPAPAGARGIKETKDVLDFVFALAEKGVRTLGDGWQPRDLVQYWDAVDELVAALRGIGQVPAELADLSGDEIAELAEHVFERLRRVVAVATR